MSSKSLHLGKVIIFVAIGMAGCSRDSSKNSTQLTIEPVDETVSTLTPEPQVSVAHIEKISPRVTYKKYKELLWQDAGGGTALQKFDSVQTHESANADVVFSNSTFMHLDENTLVVINPSGVVKPGLHRAAMR